MLKTVIVVVSYIVVVLSTDNCNFNVKVRQTLLNEGFHRNMTYEIVFNGDEDDEPWIFEDCVIGLAQSLPAGVYANPDELDDLRRANKLNVTLKNRINIELPAEQSSPSSLYIMGTIRQGRATLWVPLHARYHQAAPGGGMARNEIPAPRVLVRCAEAHRRCAGAAPPAPRLCNGGAEGCWRGYREIPYTMVSGSARWRVPVGDTGHGALAAAGSALALAAASLRLLRALHRHRRFPAPC